MAGMVQAGWRPPPRPAPRPAPGPSSDGYGGGGDQTYVPPSVNVIPSSYRPPPTPEPMPTAAPAPAAPVAPPPQAMQGLQQAVERPAPGVGWEDSPAVGDFAGRLGERIPPQLLSGLADVVRRIGRAY